MFIKLSSDFACDADAIFSFSKNDANSTRVTFKDPRRVDVIIFTEFEKFCKEIWLEEQYAKKSSKEAIEEYYARKDSHTG